MYTTAPYRIHRFRTLIVLLTLAISGLSACQFVAKEIDEKDRPHSSNLQKNKPQQPAEEKKPTQDKPKPQKPTPKPSPTTPTRCITPSDCTLKGEKCCLSRALLNGKRFTNHISEEQKGYCSTDCWSGVVKSKISDPIEVCTKMSESEICGTNGPICTYLNDMSTPIGVCVLEDKVLCETDKDCSSGNYCVIETRGSGRIRYEGAATGTCKTRILPRDLCLFRDSKIALPRTGVDTNQVTRDSVATPYCVPSDMDKPQSETDPSHSPYGRVVFFCTNNEQCQSVDSSFLCYGANVAGLRFKPNGVGICHPQPTICVKNNQIRSTIDCTPLGLTCCRTPDYSGTRTSGNAWHCVDTTLSGGNCNPFDALMGDGQVINNYGKCDTDEDCSNRFGAGISCTHQAFPYNNWVCVY